VRMLLTGANGQVGWELRQTLAPLGEVVALDRVALGLGNADSVRSCIRDVHPEVIVNAAAYTAVDRAESESDVAFAINATAPGVLAEEAKRIDALLVHYSTDYVFDGAKSTAYDEQDLPNPLSVYGRSKLEGEGAIQASGARHLILRTSWVYASRGKNFLLTMLRLARERPELRVVDDQHGAPTWAHDIAVATTKVLHRSSAQIPNGVYHLSCAGSTTWCRFAREILRLGKVTTPVVAITTSDYPTPAKRPANSMLNNTKFRETFGFALPEWDESLKRCFDSSPSLIDLPPS
jgi:dTDP-4-dehydrorhamnose reductase